MSTKRLTKRLSTALGCHYVKKDGRFSMFLSPAKAKSTDSICVPIYVVNETDAKPIHYYETVAKPIHY